MRRRKPSGRYEVVGPGLDDVSYADEGPALSRALTEAVRRVGTESTFYVRDLDGTTVGYAESYTEPGVVATLRRV